MQDIQIIEQTKNWIKNIVIDCNFCPFAAQVFTNQTIHYKVVQAEENVLEVFLQEINKLEEDGGIETTFILMPNQFPLFDDFLDVVEDVENIIIENEWEGIYQVASFHPEYQFANTKVMDAENYTNKSIYAMLHILREASVEKALQHYEHPENIPINNINFAKEKGKVYMKMLRDSCM
jgi:uncharacterized protein